MAFKGVFCLEGLWDNDLKKPPTVQPILALLHQGLGVPYIHRNCATGSEFEYFLHTCPK